MKKITGFELAVDLKEAVHLKVDGTPLYMAPEVLRGGDYSTKGEVWSVGCVLYELAVLRSPFKAADMTMRSLYCKILAGDYAPISETYSRELRDLACVMLSLEAQDRPEMAVWRTPCI